MTSLLLRLFTVCLAAAAVSAACSSGEKAASPSGVTPQPGIATVVAGLARLAPDEGEAHITPGAPHEPYMTKPATSGPHWSVRPGPQVPTGAPARWGVYADALPDEVLVHNLEHGGIGLHYNCPQGCPEIVAALEGLVPANKSQFIMSPYPDMQSRIAVTAWRRVMYLDTMDVEKVREFIRQFKGKAPENVPGNLF